MSILDKVNIKGYSNAIARWSKFGPYYAMFPIDFAFEVVEKYSKPGDYVLDPFAGRCSSVYAGGVLGRHSLGIEISPVGWLYGSVKLSPAPVNDVLTRLLDVYIQRDNYKAELNELPVFFKHCFCEEVLEFLLAARSNLDWKSDSADASLMSIILVYLHGKIGSSLSNQMPIAKSSGQAYSINWWSQKNMLTPPEIDPYTFLKSKILWRYDKGIPEVEDGKVIFGDSTEHLESIAQRADENEIKFSLLFTSPPYWSITDYHADQWLRLWMLGESPIPVPQVGEHRGRFGSKEKYYELLDNVFEQSSKLMAEKSTIYVRTDARDFTFTSTLEILKKHFPSHKVRVVAKPVNKRTQTEITGNRSNKKGEVDIILSRK